MCGIVGVVEDGSLRCGEEHLRAMAASLAHRGPDRDGFWTESGALFGHRRLAVIDLSATGDQPMASRDGRFVIAYNGEIYNHLDIRAALENDQPVEWRGSSDTETLVEALARWGAEETLARVNGMFAFGLWDRAREELTLARDPFGEKPLYYAADRRFLAFASEFRALERLPFLDCAPDPAAVAEYLRRWYVPAPVAIAKDVRKLPEGSVLRWRRGTEPSVKSYWSIGDIVARGEGPAMSPDETVDALGALLSDAVRIRMSSDVPLGALLSGGIDSSLVCSYMQAVSAVPVRTFSIGFEVAGFDEAPYARAVAGRLGTQHTELYLTEADALAVVPTLGTVYDEPFADSSQIPTTIVCALARRHVTVVLTGDGGDELFAGYERYPMAQALWRRLSRLPGRRLVGAAIDRAPLSLLAAAGPLARLVLPRRLDSRHFAGKAKRAAPLLLAPDLKAFYSAFIGGWPDPGRLVPGATTNGPVGTDRAEPAGISDLDWMLWWDTANLLSNDLLVKVDRASMAVGLEGRMPLLDRRVAEFAWRMPRAHRNRGGATKWPLRALLHRFVPRDLVERPKKGFGVPLDRWLRGALRGWAADLLSPARIRRQGLLDSGAVDGAWQGFLARGPHAASQIWTLLMLQSWMEARGR